MIPAPLPPGLGDAEAVDPAKIELFLHKAIGRARELAHFPESTYRIQFQKDFTFQDATAIVPYLAKLGVTHLYASPILKAVPGSTHGYDVIDHAMLNPELGTTEAFDTLVGALKEHGLHLMLDTVPNHVGVETNHNAWWNDVLENGRTSVFGSFFDIAWQGPRASLHDRVLLPLLGSSLGDALDKGELKLIYEAGSFFIESYERRIPLAVRTYAQLLTRNTDSLHANPPALRALEELIASASSLADVASVERHEHKEAIKRQFAEIVAEHPPLRQLVDANVAAINRSPELLGELLDAQHFRLAHWRTAPDEINYRRFFDVNGLAALTMERQEVFEAVHAFTLQLLADGKICGLRIDHPDGLYDPAEYFRRLQQHYLLALAHKDCNADDWPNVKQLLLHRLEREIPAAGKGAARWPLYVLCEKILDMDEPLPRKWAVHGTSGYDFLNFCNGIFVDARNAGELERIYQAWTSDATPFNELTYQKKRLILERSLAGDLHALALQLDRLAQRDRHSQDFTLTSLASGLREVIACFPVYRTYIATSTVSDVDRTRIDDAVQRARRRIPNLDEVLDFIRRTLLMEFGERFTEQDRAEQRRFAGKFQQLTSPTTAKGVEDTAFYLYNRLLSLNEVGGDPARCGVEPEALHRYLGDRQRDWPYAMSALSTHDTKRSEDVRARINVLSELPCEWEQKLKRWDRWNAPHRQIMDGQVSPDRNEEYAIYQTLLGAWPLASHTPSEFESFVARVQAYMVKAMREAKLHTAWTDINEPHESAVTSFVATILDRDRNGDFVDDFGTFQQRVSDLGLLNSLSQTLLKLTAPGVPDTYQGSETWDLSLVDPDNRRPVDYAVRARLLSQLTQHAEPASLLANKQDGRLKLLLHREALHLRRRHPGLFTVGEYLPLTSTGPRADHVFVFARQHQGRTAIVAVGRRFAGISESLTGPAWDGTQINLPFPVSRLRSTLTSTAIDAANSTLLLSSVFADLPWAILIDEQLQ